MARETRLLRLLGRTVRPRAEVIPAGDVFTALIADEAEAKLADYELQHRLERTAQRLERLAAELEARHQRYVWTEQLAAELRAIAGDAAAR